MRSASSLLVRLSILSAVPLAACVPVQSPTSARFESYGARRYYQVRDSLEAARRVEAESVSDADGPDDQGRAPRLRLTTLPTGGINYINASFRVSADAYVMIVAVDKDRNVRVLYPEAPDESGFVNAESANQLNQFFAGFGAGPGSGQFAATLYNRFHGEFISRSGGRGVILGIASDRPFQFDRLSEDGQWREQAIEHLVFESLASQAARRLGRALVTPGQEFSTTYTTFRGSDLISSLRRTTCGHNFSSAYGEFGYGGFPDGLGAGDGTIRTFNAILRRADGNYLVSGYVDECGRQILTSMQRIVDPKQPSQPATSDSVATNGTALRAYRSRGVTRAGDDPSSPAGNAGRRARERYDPADPASRATRDAQPRAEPVVPVRAQPAEPVRAPDPAPRARPAPERQIEPAHPIVTPAP